MSARMKLSKLLDVDQPGSDWIQLAKILGLGSFINPLKGMKSPTRALLDNYEVLKLNFICLLEKVLRKKIAAITALRAQNTLNDVLFYLFLDWISDA